MDSDRLEEVLRRAEQSLDEKDAELIRAVFESYAYVTDLVEDKNTTIRWLRQYPGCAARPWALMFNAFGARRRQEHGRAHPRNKMGVVEERSSSGSGAPWRLPARGQHAG